MAVEQPPSRSFCLLSPALSSSTMTVLTLHPEPGGRRPLMGLYLALALHRRASIGDVHIYANFIASIDGRISLWDARTRTQQVPDSLANPRDWRLYQELAAQSDVMITSARYFRQLQAGCAQDLLPVGRGDAFADLHVWRRKQGLRAQPDVVILSASLDIPPASLPRDRKTWILTGKDAEPARMRALQQAGARVVQFPRGRVSGTDVRDMLIDQGYRSAYMVAGPQVHGTMVAAGVLQTLFLTWRHRLLGGERFATILEGELAPPAELALCSLYLDCAPGFEQLYAQYRLARPSGPAQHDAREKPC